MIDLRWSILVVTLVAGLAPDAVAQDNDPALRQKHLTISGGLILSGGYDIGDRNAEIRQNATGAPAPFTLFRAASAFEGAKGVEARVGYALARALAIEVGASYAKPRLDITITGDGEADAVAVVGEEVSQYSVDVSGIYQLPRLRLGPRVRPYAIVGAGYLRQLHQSRLLVETGQTFHAGGGVRYWVRGGSAAARALGVRADVRFVHRRGGVDFDEKGRSHPAFSLLAFAGF